MSTTSTTRLSCFCTDSISQNHHSSIIIVSALTSAAAASAAEAAAIRLLQHYCECTQEEMEGRVHDAYMALLPCLGIIKEGKHFY